MLLDDKNKELALVKSIISACVLISKQLKLYGAVNRQVEQSTARLEKFLESYFLYHDSLHLTVGRHGFLYEEDFIDRKNQAFINFAYTLFQHGVNKIHFNQGISPGDIQTFLTLSNRPPAESWEEGGMLASLHLRGLDRISVSEMSEEGLSYIKGVAESPREELLREKSPIWDRFAIAVYKGLTSKEIGTDPESDQTRPGQLAELTNKVLSMMSLGSQQNFCKGLSSFLASIQHEKISRYRKKALAKLTEFINRISPEIREKLFTNIFSLNMKPSFTEEFYSGISDEIIIELLEKSARDQNYTPPVVMKVLAKIAQDKKLNIGHLGELDENLTSQKGVIEKLFKKDDFDKFVPDKYRKALLNIIQHESLTNQANEGLQELIVTLEEANQERHTADIIIKILNEQPDKVYLKGLADNLVNIVYLYLDEGKFKELHDLCLLLQSQGEKAVSFDKFRHFLSSDQIIHKILKGISVHGKNSFPDIEKLVMTVGDSFIDPLFELLATDGSRMNRLFYLKLLQQMPPVPILDNIVRHLKDSRWYVLRNLLQILSSTDDKRAMTYIKPLIGHEHPKVHNEAIRAGLKFGCEESISHLMQMLANKDTRTVDQGISLAVMVRDANVAGRLIELLRQNPVINYRLEQKKAIIRTLVETVPKGSLPVFFELLSIKNTLHPKQHKELKEEILKAFAHYDRELILPALRKHSHSSSVDVRHKLQSLQEKLEN